MSTPGPDHSVRVAWADDAAAIARVQLTTWPSLYGHLVDEADLPHDLDDLARDWHRALTTPGDARNRALVALEGNRVVGFVLTGAAADPDCDPSSVGELAELIVEPGHRNHGHGSRLVQAAVDTLAADRFTRAVTWIARDEAAPHSFLAAAGWAVDGASRELAATHGSTGSRLAQVRLHTRIA